MKAGVLVTASGEVFEGALAGASGFAEGELVFNTSLTGYQEVLTDPSYAGQVVVMTAAHIGVYGVWEEDMQSGAPAAAGLVVRDLSEGNRQPSASGDLKSFLDRHRMVALTEVDTRRLTRHLRRAGAMPAAMGPAAQVEEVARRARRAPDMSGRDLTAGVTTPEPYVLEAPGATRGTVVAVDFGLKRAILRRFVERGWRVHVVPSGTTAADILDLDPAGVFLSNGPGDPAPLEAAVVTVRSLLGRLPLFGICLGHQILGRALGARTFKLRFGHHGGNHPVRRLADGRVEITAQNHGFAVDLWSLAQAGRPSRRGIPTVDLLPASVETAFGAVRPTHQNLYDGTLEGLECLEVPAFSVQFHPEAAPGPHDAQGLFGRFGDLIEREEG